MKNRSIFTLIGATIVASLCCVTPILAALAGASSLASSFAWLTPYRTYLVLFTILVLLFAWYQKLKPKKDMDCACDEESFFQGKLFLAFVTLFVVFMLSFPLWGSKFFESAPSAAGCATGVCAIDAGEKETHTDAPEVQKESNALPVLKYMNEEEKNPTNHGQVACSGTGFKVLDEMLANARKSVPEMAPVVLKRMIDEEEAFVLLDVREFIQRAEGSIYADEVLEIPRSNLEFKILNKIRDKETTVVVYDRMGASSLLAAESLKKLGYTNVYNLSAGLKGWVRAKYPFDNGLGTVKKVVDAE